MNPTPKPIVLILCTGNSCRSHMAEGFLRAAAGQVVDVHSAGSKPAGYVHPLAIKVMAEAGVDISAHRSKHMNDYLARNVRNVITVCGNADQACPMYPGQVSRYHWGFDDPAHARGTEEEVLAEFRRIRDEIKRVFDAYGAGLRDGAETEKAPVITIRPMSEEDLEAARRLWSVAEGVHLSGGDSVNELKGYLARNPATSQVAFDGDELVGAVLAGHDGRRGFIYHLAVKSSHQRAGVGKRLVDHCLTALRGRQVVRVLLLVAQNNDNGKKFWQKCG